MHSSQNEQDSRYYARAAHIPMLEPVGQPRVPCLHPSGLSPSSEELDTPVFLRLTTRVAHARSVVAIGERADVPLRPYQKDAMKYVTDAGHGAQAPPQGGGARGVPGRGTPTVCPSTSSKCADTSIGIITSGVCYEYVRDAMPRMPAPSSWAWSIPCP